MKFIKIYSVNIFYPVAPYAGAWIEIFVNPPVPRFNDVAPYAGAWIEILLCRRVPEGSSRRPLRGGVD